MNTLKDIKDIMRTSGLIIYTLLIIATGWYMGRGYEAYSVQRAACSVQQISTVEQIQQLVGCEKIDGKLGPETMAKWNRAVCDQYAKPYFQPQIARITQKSEAGK